MTTKNQATIAQLNSSVDREHAKTSSFTYINTNPYFQRTYESWNDEMKTKFVLSILRGWITNPLWVIINKADRCNELLDGKHRLLTALYFFRNEFPIQAKFIEEEELVARYGGKKFEDLEYDDQEAVRNYSFSINTLPNTELSPDRVVYWWNILNKSSKPLNSYELNKILYASLYDLTLPFTKLFKTTEWFKGSDKRGKANFEFLKILSLTEKELPTKFTSLENLYYKWLTTTFGTKKEQIDKNILSLSEVINKRCTHVLRVYDSLKNKGLLTDDNKGKQLIDTVIVARFSSFIRPDRLTHYINYPGLKEKLNTDIYDKVNEDIVNYFGRNATCQRRVIELVDSVLSDIIGNQIEPRRFSSFQKTEKLKQQEGKCAICKKQIVKGEGDHVIPFSRGGKTTMENLQILCKECHVSKTVN